MGSVQEGPAGLPSVSFSGERSKGVRPVPEISLDLPLLGGAKIHLPNPTFSNGIYTTHHKSRTGPPPISPRRIDPAIDEKTGNLALTDGHDHTTNPAWGLRRVGPSI